MVAPKPSKAQQQLAYQRARQQLGYKHAAAAITVLLCSLAAGATYMRFSSRAAAGAAAAGAAEGIWLEAAAVAAAVLSSAGAFEANDLFAIINGVPAMVLCTYGYHVAGVMAGLCFGVGLGITAYGLGYMFVHDGLVHRRFPAGPIGQLQLLKRIAAAHQLHHSNRCGGAPWGMFLGPQELVAVPGGKEQLERLLAQQAAL